LQRQQDRFSEHNTYLFALLGLVSESQRLERWLAEQSANAEPRANTAAPTDQEAKGTQSLVYFVLGLVSLGRTLRTTVADWARGPEPPSTGASQPPGSTSGLLR
jgi:hypothetical protein